MSAITAYPGAATEVLAAGESVVAMYGPVAGGLIRNPATIAEQGIAPLVTTPEQVTRYRGPLNTYGCNAFVPLATEQGYAVMVQTSSYGPPENLYVSLTGPVVLTVVSEDEEFDVLPGQFSSDFLASATGIVAGPDAFTVPPGTSFALPQGFPGSVWVCAVSAGHRFSAVVFQPATQYPPTPAPGDFPPFGPVTRQTTIRSYLYQQYTDDDNLQALVAAQNLATQDYVDTFNALDLPDYTAQQGALLDWVGTGLYGIRRPTFFSGRYVSTGPLNTYGCNSLPALNAMLSTSDFTDVAVTTDDVYKRVLAWHLWRGDGRNVSAEWIRRRCVRFLFGDAAQGSANPVSVVSDASRNLTVTVITGVCRVIGGALCNAMPCNTVPLNSIVTTSTSYAVPALAASLQEGINTGALEMPGQYDVTCRVGPVAELPAETVIFGLRQLFYAGVTPLSHTYLATESGSLLVTETGSSIVAQ